jgi:hypothetical protein
MKTKGMTNTIIVGLIALLASLAILIPKLQVARQNQAVGSVTVGNEYVSTSTRTVAGAPLGIRTLLTKASEAGGPPGVFGSVVIPITTSGPINVYDATNTTVLGYEGWATTTLAAIPVSAIAGTYTFDTIYRKGLVLEVPGTVATATVTWRP